MFGSDAAVAAAAAAAVGAIVFSFLARGGAAHARSLTQCGGGAHAAPKPLLSRDKHL
jgi:hypothetical protein